MVVLTSRTAKFFNDTIHQFQRDIHREWHKDAYVCWAVNRGAGWVDGDTVETQSVVESGFGKLYANGKGGPQTGEMVIHLESPYRFRTVTSTYIESGNLLVLNGERFFRVDIGKPEDKDDELVDIYLTEMFTMQIPTIPEVP